MRVLHGTKIVDASPALPSGRIVIDIGAGDGRYAYESARADPESFFVGVDADAGALGEYAFKASRKPSRGGLPNALFVVAAAEALPAELQRSAALIRVNFPWSGLLRALVLPEPGLLAGLAGLAAPAARFEFVLTYDPFHDSRGLGSAQLPPLSEDYIDAQISPAYATQGLFLERPARLSREEALAVPSTWGRRLLHGRNRQVFLLQGRCGPPRPQSPPSF